MSRRSGLLTAAAGHRRRSATSVAITHVGTAPTKIVGTGTNTTATSVMPSGIAAGDLLILELATGLGPYSTTLNVSGWTSLRRVGDPATAPAEAALEIWWKIAASSGETAPTITIATTTRWHTVIRAFRGVDPTTPFLAENGAAETASVSTHSASALSNTNSAAWGVYSLVSRQVGTPYTATPGSGLTERVDQDNGVTGTSNLMYYAADSGGPVTAGTVTYSATGSAASQVAVMWAALLKPNASGSVPVPPPRPFTAYSGTHCFFKSTVAGAPIDAAATTAFRNFMNSDPDGSGRTYPALRGADQNLWGTPWALAVASDPVWTLTGVVPAEVSQLTTSGFHAPEWFGQILTGTTDSPFVVLDAASGMTVWAAGSSWTSGHTISVTAAGLFMHGSNGLDQRNPLSDSTVNFRSRGAIPDAIVIRRDLVDYGIAYGTDLGHVLHMFFAETDTAAGFCHPMVGNESGKLGFGAEGLRVAIDPAADLTTRGLSPAALVVARTLQNYGAYLGDNAGAGGTGLKLEQQTADHVVWNGLLSKESLLGLVWNDFVVLPQGWPDN